MTAADLTPLPCMHDTYACSHHGGVGPPYLPFGCSSGSWSLGGRLSLWTISLGITSQLAEGVVVAHDILGRAERHNRGCFHGSFGASPGMESPEKASVPAPRPGNGSSVLGLFLTEVHLYTFRCERIYSVELYTNDGCRLASSSGAAASPSHSHSSESSRDSQALSGAPDTRADTARHHTPLRIPCLHVSKPPVHTP